MCGLTVSPFATAFFASRPGGEQHARVRRVRARGDGGDQHVAVAEVDAVGSGCAPVEARRPACAKPLSAAAGRRASSNVALSRRARSGPAGASGPATDGRIEARSSEHRGRVVDVARSRHAVEALRLEVGRERVDLRRAAAGRAEVVDGRVVDREEAHRRAVLGRHVGDRRAVGDGERRRALAEELDELADDLLAAQHLGHRQHQVGRGDALGEPAGQLDADDVGRQEVDRLAQHAGLGLDAAHAPADDADAVDHRRVAVGADQRVRIVDVRRFGARRGRGTRG